MQSNTTSQKRQGEGGNAAWRGCVGYKCRGDVGPLGPLGYDFSQHSPTTRPSVGRTAGKAFLLSGRVELSSAEAHVIKGGTVGVVELTQDDRTLAHTELKSALIGSWYSYPVVEV